MRLADPWFLSLLLLLPVFLKWRPQPKKVPKLLFASAVKLTQAPQSLRLRLRTPVLRTLKLCAAIGLVLALARPQTGMSFAQTDAEARDIFLTLDVSGSMHALDFFLDGERVNRLTALKSVMKNFVKERVGDRIALVVFGTDVFTQCPLTLDHNIVQEYIDSLEIGMAGDNTALGDSIAVSLKRLKDIEGDSKVIVLVTDGLKTSGRMEPLQAAEIAKKQGVKIYTIGIGGKDPAPFKTTDFFGREVLQYREVPVDEAALKGVAEMTGGRYFNATKLEDLQEIYREIDKLELRKAEAQEFVDYEEHFILPLSIGLLATLLLLILSQTIYRSLP